MRKREVMEGGSGSWRPFLILNSSHTVAEANGGKRERASRVGPWIVVKANKYIKAVRCFGEQEDD